MITGIVYGQLVSKSNSRQAVPGKTKAGKSFTRYIKSTAAFEFEESALYQLKKLKPPTPLKGSLCLSCVIYFQSRRSDLDESLFMDILQKAELIENDRQIDIKHIYKQIDPLNPRVEFTVEVVNEEGA